MEGVNMLEILIQQHRRLKQQLDNVVTSTKAEKPNGLIIVQALNEFGRLLKEHLAMEDGVFYPQILEKMRSKGMETAGTEDFIKRMGVIAKDVYEFLKKYNNSNAIENDIATFGQDLRNISLTLVLRITTEEDGVYMYWNL